MNDYEARKQAKADRYRQYAANAEKRGEGAYRAFRQIADGIPMGQPILVGHHSEKRHRRDLDRMDRNLGKSVEEDKKAAYWSRRAAAVEDDTSISRHDPEALTKLDEKIKELEAVSARHKAINKTIRKLGFAAAESLMTPEDKADLLAVARTQPYYDPLHKGFPPYDASNRNGNLRRYKARREELAQDRETDRRRLAYITVKYAGECAGCGTRLERGTYALYDRNHRELFCKEACVDKTDGE